MVHNTWFIRVSLLSRSANVSHFSQHFTLLKDVKIDGSSPWRKIIGNAVEGQRMNQILVAYAPKTGYACRYALEEFFMIVIGGE